MKASSFFKNGSADSGTSFVVVEKPQIGICLSKILLLIDHFDNILTSSISSYISEPLLILCLDTKNKKTAHYFTNVGQASNQI